MDRLSQRLGHRRQEPEPAREPARRGPLGPQLAGWGVAFEDEVYLHPLIVSSRRHDGIRCRYGTSGWRYEIQYRHTDVCRATPPYGRSKETGTRRDTMGKLRFVVVAMLLSASALVGPANRPAAASEPLAGARWTEEYIPSEAGRLHADIFRPEGLTDSDRTPVLMLISPYLSSTSLAEGLVYAPGTSEPSILGHYRPFYEDGIQRGYTVVSVSLPGTGASGGCADLQGRREQAAAAAAVRWAATRNWSTGRVGTFGGSYDGWTQVAALAQRVEGHAAAVVMAPVVDAYVGYFTNGVPHYLGLAERISQEWAGSSNGLNPAPVTASPEEHKEAVAGAGQQPGCSTERASGAHDPDPNAPVWRERRLSDRLVGTTVPTFQQSGLHDFAVGMGQFPLLWSRLEGPRRLWLGQIDHRPPNAFEDVTGRGGDFYANAMRWFDRYVRGVDNGVEDEPAVEVEEGYAGAWRNERAWPPADVRTASMPVLGGEFRDLIGNKAQPGDGPAGLCQPSDPRETRCYHPPTGYGQGIWTISQPLGRDLHLAGRPHLEVEVEADLRDGSLVALLYDIDLTGDALLLTRGAHLVNGKRSLSFDLYPQDWHLRSGHRLGLLLTGSDGEMFVSRNSGARVLVSGGELRLPVVRRKAAGTLPSSHGNTLLARRATFPVETATIADREVSLCQPRGPRCSDSNGR